MTLEELTRALKPITEAALAEQADLDVVQASGVLSALTGALVSGDRALIDALFNYATTLVDQRVLEAASPSNPAAPDFDAIALRTLIDLDSLPPSNEGDPETTRLATQLVADQLRQAWNARRAADLIPAMSAIKQILQSLAE